MRNVMEENSWLVGDKVVVENFNSNSAGVIIASKEMLGEEFFCVEMYGRLRVWVSGEEICWS